MLSLRKGKEEGKGEKFILHKGNEGQKAGSNLKTCPSKGSNRKSNFP
jgi:hypothetical protein